MTFECVSDIFGEDPVGGRPPSPVVSAAAALLPGTAIPYSPDSQPKDNTKISTSSSYSIIVPAIGEQNPAQPVGSETTLEALAPIFSVISVCVYILGPIKAVLDIILAIIEVLCSLLNPFSLAEAMAKLFAALIGLIGLIPPVSGAILLLDAVKSVIVVLAALIVEVLPILDLIVENATAISESIKQNQIVFAASASKKICGLIKLIENKLAIISPINALITTIFSFASIAFKWPPCSGESDCTSCQQCPPLLLLPPVATSASVFRSDNSSPTSYTVVLDGIKYGSGQALGDITPGSAWSRSYFQRSEEPTSATPDLGFYLSDLNFYIAQSVQQVIKLRLRYSASGNTKTEIFNVLSATISGSRLIVTLQTELPARATITLAQFIADETLAMSQNPSPFLQVSCSSLVLAAKAQNITALKQNPTLGGLSDALGITAPPTVDTRRINSAFQNLFNDPTNANIIQTEIVPAFESLIADNSALAAKLICVIANATSSSLSSSGSVALIGDKGGTELIFRVCDAQGNLILKGMPASVDFNAIFTTTLGTVNDVQFDSATGLFTARLKSNVAGTATVSVALATTGVCMSPKIQSGTTIKDAPLTISFVDGSLKPRKPERQYVQSAGGRRR